MKEVMLATCLTTALAVGPIGAIAAPSTEDETARCVTKGAVTLTANSDVRLYQVQRGTAGDLDVTAIYACRYATGKRIALTKTYEPLDDDGDQPVRYLQSVALSQEGTEVPAVAYVDTNCRTGTCKSTVVLRSTSDGKAVRKLAAGSSFDLLAVSGLALAWLERSPDGSCKRGCRVHLVTSSGDKVLDQGTDIDPDRFGALADEAPGRPSIGGTNEFVWKRGTTVKIASFNG